MGMFSWLHDKKEKKEEKKERPKLLSKTTRVLGRPILVFGAVCYLDH